MKWISFMGKDGLQNCEPYQGTSAWPLDESILKIKSHGTCKRWIEWGADFVE